MSTIELPTEIEQIINHRKQSYSLSNLRNELMSKFDLFTNQSSTKHELINKIMNNNIFYFIKDVN